MKLIHEDNDMKLYLGSAVQFPPTEGIDFILTNPYGKMPLHLATTPAILHQWVHRKMEAEAWSGMNLHRIVGAWNRGREAFWANEHILEYHALDLSMYVPEGGGWYPEGLVTRILSRYVLPGQTVWDGFMGRGTIGKICRAMGIKYIGVEQLPKHMDIAKAYLEIPS